MSGVTVAWTWLLIDRLVVDSCMLEQTFHGLIWANRLEQCCWNHHDKSIAMFTHDRTCCQGVHDEIARLNSYITKLSFACSKIRGQPLSIRQIETWLNNTVILPILFYYRVVECNNPLIVCDIFTSVCDCTRRLIWYIYMIYFWYGKQSLMFRALRPFIRERIYFSTLAVHLNIFIFWFVSEHWLRSTLCDFL